MSALRANLPTIAKKWIWNLKYARGRRSIATPPADLVDQLASLDRRASVLDLGAGEGSLLWALRRAGWRSHYCGVDISGRAIRRALKCNDHRSTWIIGDIEGFQSALDWDVIVLAESIYYIPLATVPVLMQRIVTMLAPGGRVLIRIHDANKHHAYIDAMRHTSLEISQVGEGLFCLSPPTAQLAEAST